LGSYQVWKAGEIEAHFSYIAGVSTGMRYY
jgi:hypothetical protein